MPRETEHPNNPTDLHGLVQRIKHWGHELGFQQIHIIDTDLGEAEAHLLSWPAQGESAHTGKLVELADHPEQQLVVTILHPFPDVAGGIVQPPVIGREGAEQASTVTSIPEALR